MISRLLCLAFLLCPITAVNATAQSVGDLFNDKNCTPQGEMVFCTMPDGSNTEFDAATYAMIQLANKQDIEVVPDGYLEQLQQAVVDAEEQEQADIEREEYEANRPYVLGDFFSTLVAQDQSDFADFYERKYEKIKTYEPRQMTAYDNVSISGAEGDTYLIEVPIQFDTNESEEVYTLAWGNIHRPVRREEKLLIRASQNAIQCTQYWFDTSCEARTYPEISPTLLYQAIDYLNTPPPLED